MSAKKRLETGLDRAVAMERGGNLEALLEREAAEIKKEFYEEALRRRHEAARHEADFSPSGMPALPTTDDASGGDQAAIREDPGR